MSVPKRKATPPSQKDNQCNMTNTIYHLSDFIKAMCYQPEESNSEYEMFTIK